MDEFSFIRSIQPKFYRNHHLIKGIGDDMAVFRQASDHIITAVDTFVDGVHFSRKTMKPHQIGYRVLAVNLSDIAAMGGCPAFYLVSIVVPKSWKKEEIQAIFQGMDPLAKKFQLDLIGGDTVSGHELVISVTIIGFVQEGKVRYRSDAKPGDIAFVTGTLGDSRAGLHILLNEGKYKGKEYFISRHVMPEPRINFSKQLTFLKRIALNDVSDGIISEAMEVAEASNVSIVIKEDFVPVHKDFNQFPKKLQRKWKLFGGEDFELFGTVPLKDWPYIQQIAQKEKLVVTKVGYVTDRNIHAGAYVYLEKEGKLERVTERGYTHLK